MEGSAEAGPSTETSELTAKPSLKWTWEVFLNKDHVQGLVYAIDNNFNLPHSGYNESLGASSLPNESEGPTETVHQQLDDEIENPLDYEVLSKDIHDVPELKLNAIPLAFHNYPLHCGTGVNWPSHLSSNKNPADKRMLPIPHYDYVQRPILCHHKMVDNQFSIGSDIDMAIYIGSDNESTAVPDAVAKSQPDSVYVDSDIEIVGTSQRPASSFINLTIPSNDLTLDVFVEESSPISCAGQQDSDTQPVVGIPHFDQMRMMKKFISLVMIYIYPIEI